MPQTFKRLEVSMDPKLYADRVAEIAQVYAYRRRHHIAHTGHTVHRLLDAVSALLGQRVTLAGEVSDAFRVSPSAGGGASPDPTDASVQQVTFTVPTYGRAGGGSAERDPVCPGNATGRP